MTTEDTRTEDGAQDVPDQPEARPAKRTLLTRWAQLRASRARTAQERVDGARVARQRRDAERDRQRELAVRAATASRRASRSGANPVLPDEIAPVPQRMRWLGVWADRTLGALPLLAPLALSGYFTQHVFTGEPIGAPGAVALLATLALEGGVWKVAGLRARTLLEGDSTVSLQLTLALFLTIISGLIYWHADHLARSGGLDGAWQDWGWVPAAGCAAFSMLGVRIWTHNARFQHRAALRAAGRVDKQAPRFALLSWVLCPVETPMALRHAVKYRIDSPIDAVEDRRLWVASGKPAVWPLPSEEDTEQDDVPVRTAPDPRDRAGADGRDGDGTDDEREQDGDVPQDGRDEIGEYADVLRYAEHLLLVTKAFPDWRTKEPAVRAIRDVIHAHRQAIDGGGFRSMSVSGVIQKKLIKLRGRPELLDTMKMTDTDEPDSTP